MSCPKLSSSIDIDNFGIINSPELGIMSIKLEALLYILFRTKAGMCEPLLVESSVSDCPWGGDKSSRMLIRGGYGLQVFRAPSTQKGAYDTIFENFTNLPKNLSKKQSKAISILDQKIFEFRFRKDFLIKLHWKQKYWRI